MTCYCYSCGDDISSGEQNKKRSRLSAIGMQRSLSVLVAVVAEQNCDVETAKLPDGYVCRSCSGLLDRFSSLKQNLSSKIKTALPRLPRSGAGEQSSPNPPRVRLSHTNTSAEAGTVAITSKKSPAMVVS